MCRVLNPSLRTGHSGVWFLWGRLSLDANIGQSTDAFARRPLSDDFRPLMIEAPLGYHDRHSEDNDD